MKNRVVMMFALVVGLSGAVSVLQASTIDYWRMESDTVAADSKITVANEIAGRPSMTTEASAGALSSDVAVATVPQTNANNTNSLNPNNTSNGRVSGYDAITGSVTVEFWAKTSNTVSQLVVYNDSFGTFENTNLGGKGFAIVNANRKIKVLYQVGTDAANNQVTLETADIVTGSGWNHIAWTYDQATGVGSLYIDGTLADSHDGADGLGLFWGTGEPNDALRLGRGNTTGLFDELRIDDTALSADQFLLNAVPEPGSMALAVGGVALMGLKRPK